MARPTPRKSSLAGGHPAAPAPPPQSAPSPKAKTARTKMTFYTDAELAAQARAAFQYLPPSAHGCRSLSELIEDALRRRVGELQDQHNDGQPWQAVAPGEGPRGRPLD